MSINISDIASPYVQKVLSPVANKSNDRSAIDSPEEIKEACQAIKATSPQCAKSEQTLRSVLFHTPKNSSMDLGFSIFSCNIPGLTGSYQLRIIRHPSRKIPEIAVAQKDQYYRDGATIILKNGVISIKKGTYKSQPNTKTAKGILRKATNFLAHSETIIDSLRHINPALDKAFGRASVGSTQSLTELDRIKINMAKEISSRALTQEEAKAIDTLLVEESGCNN